MLASKLIAELKEVNALYGNLYVRVDLGSETEQRAYPVGSTMVASFTNEGGKVCLVVFLNENNGKGRDKFTCTSLAETIAAWQYLIGDVEVRVDLGFFASGYCYDIDSLMIGDFTSEHLRALVIYPRNAVPTIKVNGTGFSVN